VAFQPNYVPHYPFNIHITLTSNSLNCAYVSLKSPSSVQVNSSGQPNPTVGFYISVQLAPYYAANANLNYTLSSTVSDSSRPNKTATNNGATYGPKYLTYCLTPDTLITGYFGNQVVLRDIKVGDELLSINRETMDYEKTIVTNKSSEFVDELYIVNDKALKCSKGHQHIIKRDGEWTVVGSEYLVVGDTMLDSSRNETKINKIDIIK